MENLRDLLRGFFGSAPSQVGYSQPNGDHEQQVNRDPDTLSASVNLEDIIDEYDEPSRNTITNTRHLTDERVSQSFFSFSGARDEETTSFYSALHDGFSLDEPDTASKHKSSRDFFWNKNHNSNKGNGELDTMLRQSDFQISWTDLTYTIRPRGTFAYVWEEFKGSFVGSLSSAFGLVNYFRSATYNVNGDGASKGTEIENNHASDTITILRDVNGSFQSGQLTAIMGPSGAGKTSLLNILSRRIETGFTGRLCVSETSHRIKINAIPQDDHLLGSLTARENLLFASKLKNPNSNQDHEKSVYSVSKLLGLTDCLDTRTKNLSGGQLKRLAIAQELLSKPDILILDEPTSGLDSLTCLKTLAVLKDLVRQTRRDLIDPIAIIFTIHQPQQEAFRMFDKVYVLATGGIVIYDGPPDECVSFIEKYSGLTMPSLEYNPASFLIEIASGEYGQEPIDSLAQQVRMNVRRHQEKLWPKGANFGVALNADHSLSATETKNLQTDTSISLYDTTPKTSDATNSDKTKHKAELYLDPRLVKRSSINSGGFIYKTLILTVRCWKSSWRDPKQKIARILFHIMLPFGLVLMLGTGPGASNACPKYQSEYSLQKMMSTDEYLAPERQEEFLLALENIGTIFITVYACISASIAESTLIFALDLRTCMKEYYNGWYSMNSYVFARIISNLPLDLTLPLITVALSYVITGQNTGPDDSYFVYRILYTGLAIILGSLAGEIMGMTFGIIYIGHITTALFASQGATLPFVLLSGFVARTKNMSKFVRLLSYTSLYKHCLEAAFIARYGWNVCNCKMDGNFKQVTLTGVADNLRSFINNWMSAQDEDQENDDTTNAISSATSVTVNSTDASSLADSSTENDANNDVFQMVAKQLSLYNTYGIEVKSCDQVVPYEMNDFDLTEKELPVSFLALTILLVFMLVMLLIVVKLVLTYRTSL